MFNKIVVPLDGSELAEAILPYVETLAQKLKTDVDLVGVCEPVDTRQRLCGAYLEQVASRVKAGAAKVRQVVLPGKLVAEEILDYADKNKVDLIAMTTRGLSGVSRWVVGSIAEKVLRASSAPVLLVRGKQPQKAGFKTAKLEKILVPLDGSDLGEAALPYVTDLANGLGCEVVLLRVEAPIAEVIATHGEAVALDPKLVAQQRAALAAQVNSYLARITAGLQAKGIKVSSEMREGLPANEIIAFSERNAIDLIAMSTHGRTGFSRWVYGSVTDKVLHSTETPLLVIRPRQKT
ncbi:MAG: universal stress protein [Chloroflexi bacterium]|nr:universal stress protein [Chloroflexota bacterium]